MPTLKILLAVRLGDGISSVKDFASVSEEHVEKVIPDRVPGKSVQSLVPERSIVLASLFTCYFLSYMFVPGRVKVCTESLLAHVGSIDEHITFTVEREVHGQLPFLCVAVRREDGGLLRTSVYRKTNAYGPVAQV